MDRTRESHRARLSSWRSLASAALLLFAPAAFALAGPFSSGLVGAYQSHQGKKGPSIDVSLGGDGSATVTEDAGSGEVTLFGSWTDAGGQIKITFNADGQQPAAPPMIFETEHDGLQAVTWDHGFWGKTAPPPMKKSTKVKTTYWLTMD